MATFYSNTQVNGAYQLVFDIWQGTQNIANNTTMVHFTLKIKCQKSPYACQYVGNGGVFTATVNGQTFTLNQPSYSLSNGQTYTAISNAVTVTHNADGTKAVSFSFSKNGAAVFNAYAPGDMSGSGSLTLTTIPRASSITCSNSVELGKSLSITINRAASSFTHTVTYSIGGSTGTISSNAGTSCSWTPSLDLAAKITGNTSGTATITCKTYSGSAQVGTSSKSVTLTVPASIVPKNLTLTAAETVSSIATDFDGYVKNKSSIRFTAGATANYGAAITNYTLVFCGKTTSQSGGTFTITPTAAGSQTATLTVKDSRGRTSQKGITLTILDYEVPKISAFRAYRCDEDGTRNESGTRVKIEYQYSISPVNNRNTKRAALQRIDGSTAVDLIPAITDQYSVNTSLVTPDGYSTQTAYKFELAVQDKFTTTRASVTVPESFLLFHWGKSGRSIAFGKKSSDGDNVFENAMRTAFDEVVTFAKAVTCNAAATFNEAVTFAENITAKGTLLLQSNSWPGRIDAQSAAGKKRWELYSNSSSGAASDVLLNVYSDDNGTQKSTYKFQKSGTLTSNAFEINRTECGIVPGASNNLRMAVGTKVVVVGSNGSVLGFSKTDMVNALGSPSPGSYWSNGNSVVLITNGDGRAWHGSCYAEYWPENNGWYIKADITGNIRVNYLILGWD